MGRFFQVTAARQRDFTLRGRPEPRDGLPVGAPRGLSRARFGGVLSGYGPVFQVNRKKDGAGLAGQLSFHGIGDVFFRSRVFFRLTGKSFSHVWHGYVEYEGATPDVGA